MTPAFLCADEGAAELERDLATAGVTVVAAGPPASLLRDVLRAEAQILVARHRHPVTELLPALAALREHAALPVLLFTADGGTDTLAAALEAGVDTCVVNGYAPHRLRALIQLSRLRFERERRHHHDMAALSERFEERKLVDRAKGILMGAAQLPEDEAFRLLRVGSMRLKQRVGRVSQQVIEAAHCAQAINRAGALRFLSQRVVLQRALAHAGIEPRQALAEVQAALARADASLRDLDKLLPASTYGDLRAAAQSDWQALAAALGTEPKRFDVAALPAIDARAQACVRSADRLVAALEAAGYGGEPHIVNLCGRQRMLGQCLAKQALLAALVGASYSEPGSAADVIAEFDQALALLQAAPLGNAPLRERLAEGVQAWAVLQAATRGLHNTPADASGRRHLAGASERVLEIFEDLTGRYERCLELLIG